MLGDPAGLPDPDAVPDARAAVKDGPGADVTVRADSDPRLQLDVVADHGARADLASGSEMRVPAHQHVVADGDAAHHEQPGAWLVRADDVHVLPEERAGPDAHEMGLQQHGPRGDPGPWAEPRAKQAQRDPLVGAALEEQRLEEREEHGRRPALHRPAHAAW